MANTYEAIATVTVGSGGAADIEFTSIPATYTDLLVMLSARSTQTQPNGGAAASVGFNTYVTAPTSRALRGQGSGTPASFTNNQFVITPSDFTSSTFGNASIYITNYAGSTNKSFSIDSVSENNATLAEAQFNAQLWSVTDAITSVKITPIAGDFAQYSTATLYGIKNS
jgi:hypothetical protein